MAQGSIGLRFNIDTSQARTQVEGLSRTVADLNDQIRKATEAEDWRSVAMLTQALDNTTSSRGSIMQQANQVQGQQARANMRNGGFDATFSGGASWIILQQALNQITSGIIKSMDAALTAARQRASGDYAGASVSQQRATGEITGQAIGTGLGALGFLIPGVGAILGPILMGIGSELGDFIGGIGAKQTETNLAFANQYKSAFQYIDALNQNFGGNINQKTGEENNRHGLSMYSRATESAAGTGLSTQQFIEAMKQTGAYGIGSETKALNMAHMQAMWSRFTGVDSSAVQKLAGRAYRFGGDSDAVSTAYGGLMSQNMAKGQFGEFLNAMERILEEGISKGFNRSTEEIASNMSMLYKLSGGSSLWQGEQGAQRLSQMNAAVANATNLQSVEDVVSFSVARDIFNNAGSEDAKKALLHGGMPTNTYVDYMMMLEQGLSPEMLKGQFEAVDRLEGNNDAGKIERFKTMFGLNYTGGRQVLSMMEAARGEDGELDPGKFDAEKYVKQIKDLKVDPKFQSDSTNLQDAMNKMTDNLVNIGKFKFDETEWGILKTQADNIQTIRDKLEGRVRYPMPGISEEVIQSRMGGMQVIGTGATNTITNRNGHENATGLERYRELQDKYQEIISGYDARVLGNDALVNQLADPSNPHSFPAMIADGEFTAREAAITEKNLETLVEALDRGAEALRRLTAMEEERLLENRTRDRDRTHINITIEE